MRKRKVKKAARKEEQGRPLTQREWMALDKRFKQNVKKSERIIRRDLKDLPGAYLIDYDEQSGYFVLKTEHCCLYL